MDPDRLRHSLAALVVLCVHGLALVLAGGLLQRASKGARAPQSVIQLVLVPPEPPAAPAAPEVLLAPTLPEPSIEARALPLEPPPVLDRPPATQAAPPAPTAAEWAFAAGYALKNSKGYRHSWGRQVRSLMGTAVEGPDQGLVRFRVEIAPDGRLIQLETLWSTSPLAERLARQAIEAMPPLPPTPTGQPLIFERTISFSPFATDDAPVYRNDCRPDPPVFRNPFAWDGRAPQVRAEQKVDAPLDPQALAECLRQLPTDSLEAESANDQRHIERGRSSRLGR
ncbi:energy transducer TonB family protein [Roseateles microcysteis]|uniref:energy transducer TonB family protein n=1 Tax=Roseateles microcysteis TaxID=3119057 RepID=UPI002FE67716